MGLYGVFFPLLLVKIVGEGLRGVEEVFIYNICPSQVELYWMKRGLEGMFTRGVARGWLRTTSTYL